MENNLADAIAALARNVWHQGDGPRSKVREPDPFDGTDPAKLQTFLVQLQLSFNDHPHAFTNDQNKVNFAISYLKGIALAHFENSLIEPDLLNPPDWEDDYGEFVSELKTYFESPDIVGEAESKLENLSMKPNQRIAKYLVEFNRLATITGWDNQALRHQFYRGDKRATTLDGFSQIFHNFIRFNIHILSDRNRMTPTHSHIITGFRQVYRSIPNDFWHIALGNLDRIRHAASPRTGTCETIGVIIWYQ